MVNLQLAILLFRDADDAVNGRNNYNFDGFRLKVERPRQSASAHTGRSTYIKGRPGPPSQRSNYRVIVEGWSYLKLVREVKLDLLYFGIIFICLVKWKFVGKAP